MNIAGVFITWSHSDGVILQSVYRKGYEGEWILLKDTLISIAINWYDFEEFVSLFIYIYN